MYKLLLILFTILLMPVICFAEPRTSNNDTSETWYGPSYGGGEPAKGAYVTDSNTGNTIHRITETSEVSGAYPAYAAHQRIMYSRYTPVNSDGDKMMAVSGQKIWIWDLDTDTALYRLTNIFQGSDDNLGEGNDPRWDYSGLYPKRIYWHSGMSLYQCDYDNCEPTTTLVHDFTDDVTGVSRVTTYDWTNASKITMDAEGDSSNDSRYWAFLVMGDYAYGYYPTLLVISYDKETDTVLGTLEMEDVFDTPSGTRIGTSINAIESSPDGDRVLIHGNGAYNEETRFFFDETSGTTVADSGTGDDDGTASVDVSNMTVSPKVACTDCYAFEFNGTDECIEIDDVEALKDGRDDGSIAFWFNDQGSDGTVISFGDTDGNSLFRLYWTASSSNFTAQMMVDDVVQWQAASPAISSGWRYVSFAKYDSSTGARLYVDGVEETLTWSVSTDKTIWLDDVPDIDNGRIGCLNWHSFGNVLHKAMLMDDLIITDTYGMNQGTVQYYYGNGNGTQVQYDSTYMDGPHIYPMDFGHTTFSTGTVAVTNGSATVTGTSSFTGNVSVNDKFHIPAQTGLTYGSDHTNAEFRWYTVSAVDGTELTLSENFEGTTGSGLTYNVHDTAIARISASGTHSGWAWDKSGDPAFYSQNNKNDWQMWSDYDGKWIQNHYHGDLDWGTGWHYLKVYDKGKKGWVVASSYGSSGPDFANALLYAIELVPYAEDPTIWTISPQYGDFTSYSSEHHCGLDLSGNQIFCGWDWGLGDSDGMEVYRVKMPLTWGPGYPTTNLEWLYDTGIAPAVVTGAYQHIKLQNVTFK